MRMLSLTLRLRLCGLIIGIMVIFVVSIGLIAQESDFETQMDVKIQMSDGIYLKANVFLPNTGDKIPTILVRNAYGKNGLSFIGEYFAPHGYAVVIQDIRGRYASEGNFTTFADEKRDGLETLDWIVAQPWSDGQVGLWGVSYLAYCGLIMAPERHPALKTMTNSSGITSVYNIMYLDGSFDQTMIIWMKRPEISGVDYLGVFDMIPLKTMADSVLDRHAKTFINHETFDFFYDNLGIEREYDRIDIPILHSTGWNDLMYPGTLTGYRQISRTNPHQKLMIGPWTHNQQLSTQTTYGDEDFGPNAAFGVEKDMALCLRWFDYHLKGIDNGIMDEPRVKYFLMGKNEWRTADQFPPENTSIRKWYLHSSKGANSSKGDGALSPKLPRKGSDTFIYDPLHPVPTKGGVCSHMTPSLAGIKDQREVEEREDVLVYTTEPLEETVDIVGDVIVRLYVSSDAVDTDFMAKLAEVRSDGYVRIIEDGVAKTRFRNGFEKMEKIVPGEIVELEVNVGSTAISISKGHRIRLEISSSNYPKYPRNPNTGVTELNATEFQKATQTVYHTKKYPSYVALPVLVPDDNP